MVERIDPSCIAVIGGKASDIRHFVESDFKIRSGLCPNGHGLMQEVDYGQECPACGFSCNTQSEKVIQ